VRAGNTIHPEDERVLAYGASASWPIAKVRTVFQSEHYSAGKAAILAAFPELTLKKPAGT
jgi:hypothetical protein